ncbi:MAG: carboxypeptidase-like regulatory domain-containing protein [Patescibacteria group bacterium]|nr:carboxypeptidase-like regulatory domain-containing protein [Patescibacteria group bacterium]
MKKILPNILSFMIYDLRFKRKALIFILLILNSYFIYLKPAEAGFKVPVQAQVGKFYLNLSGYISPYASVVLTIDGVFIRATVADAGGNFSISGVLIKEGFSKFCLEAVDFKRLGDSFTCFAVPPAKGDVTMTKIFLPPTLGLSKNVIAEGGETLAFGYTMPGAEVTLYLSNGQKLTTFADSTGYYIFRIKGLKAGKYNLYARAVYNDKQSLAPTRTLQLQSLSLWEQIIAFIKSIINKIIKFFSSWALGPLWIALPILILIIILILKIWPEKFTFIYQSRLIIFFTRAFRKPKKPLHHAWWLGF